MKISIENWFKERGWWITPVGVAITAAYGWWLCQKVKPRWAELDALELNALGDFLAGAFGPPAFLWLLLGYMLQRYELRENREALKQQAVELASSVKEQRKFADAQSKLVEVTREQFQEEMIYRREELGRERAKYLPKFEFFNLELDVDQSVVYSISVLNVGNDAKRVSFNFSDKTIDCCYQSEDVWSSGDKKVISFHSLVDKAVIGEVILIINFFDALGFSGLRRYKFSSQDGLSFRIEEFSDKDTAVEIAVVGA